MSLTLKETPITGMVLVQGQPFRDRRGFFYRAFCDQQLASVLGGRIIRQINISQTMEIGAIRGLHFQTPPATEMKLVRCLRGRVWDVVVDLREGSKTFLEWHGVELEPNASIMVVIPEGCAHGFQVLETGSELLYLHTAPYTPTAEGGLRYNDPRLGISWPLVPTDLSQRDQTHPLLADEFSGISL
ncbi:dTDP-4-dehydrorhamnose 3,5-epimerase family protein [Candidatus Synechococcus calcipolaris G9]|uniref:dTDP-4-dehydrorhamnose 3,5-epimerase family protein n=1 Tax=Candidatus Synechococcus calcipolaris G9 TaxID=1497997 RepID=A0ABT6EVZ6_9SYNE|nr:dTDP-4-dehydrorhamnose 3,5-epimerase family protein [Candidatus Synechococcus calcipolaris]MDG2989557.1 dTDP-4-dehydrorhamnose 3,5-epimerase family protein [Candidatus Synechococcus calcipolaris G9]